MIISPRQLAEKLGITHQTVLNWCRSGLLMNDAHRMGSRWVINWTGATLLPIPGAETPYKTRRAFPKGRKLGTKNKRPYPKKARGQDQNGGAGDETTQLAPPLREK